VLGRAEQHDARVVHEDVEAAEPLHGLRHGVLRLGLVGDVGLEDQGRATCALGARGEVLQAVPAAGDEGDGRLPGEGQRGGLADAGAHAGHEGGRTGEHGGAGRGHGRSGDRWRTEAGDRPRAEVDG
jgi:hypothetical protein